MSMEVNREPRKKHYVCKLIYDKEIVIYSEEKIVPSINSFGQQHEKELNWTTFLYNTQPPPPPQKTLKLLNRRPEAIKLLEESKSRRCAL